MTEQPRRSRPFVAKVQPSARADQRSSGRIGLWATRVLGAVLVLIGLLLAAGGAWLLILGGSWYYLVAGLGLILSGGLMLAKRLAGVWVYLLVYAFTWAWALWEVGLDPWPLVPRVVAPTVLLVLVLLTIPVLRKLDVRQRAGTAHGTVTAGLVLLVLGPLGLGAPVLRTLPAMAQEEPPPAVAPEDDAPQSEVTEAPATSPATEAGPAVVPEVDTADKGAAARPGDPAEEVETANAEQDTAQAQAPAAPLETGENWPAYGGTYHGTRYSPLDQITRDNVGQLERVRTFRTVKELRLALVNFRQTYNEHWLIGRHGHRSPAQFRCDQMDSMPLAA